MFWRTFVTVWLVVCPAVVMAETRVDVNRHKDFNQYKTFTIEVTPPVRDGAVDDNNTIAMNRLRRAITSELHLHGLRQVDSGGDLMVRARSRETERTELVGSGYPYGGYGPWGYGYGGYWAGPYWGGDVWTYRYFEGTTTIDLIEPATGDLVYRAEVIRKVEDDEDDLDDDAVKIARKAFKKFPVGRVFEDH